MKYKLFSSLFSPFSLFVAVVVIIIIIVLVCLLLLMCIIAIRSVFRNINTQKHLHQARHVVSVHIVTPAVRRVVKVTGTQLAVPGPSLPPAPTVVIRRRLSTHSSAPFYTKGVIPHLGMSRGTLFPVRSVSGCQHSGRTTRT